MNRIIYVGMDVHSTSFTFCALEPSLDGEDKVFGICEADADYRSVIKYIDKLKEKQGKGCEFVCGYEAGCLGYTLQRQLAEHGVRCEILAPTTMLVSKGKRVKTDKRDAKVIAQCLAYGTYSVVHVPDKGDDAVKEYIRMRDDHRGALKKLKQQINAFCLRHGQTYSGKSKWTAAHLEWLRKLELESLLRETLDEYLLTYTQLKEKIGVFEKRIEEVASGERYESKVKKLSCFLGVKTPTALATIVESGDFKRFKKGNVYAAYIGLTPSEHSSGDSVVRGGISKAGNTHLRRLFVEASQSICKGQIGHKSKELSARQKGNDSEVIAYADKANERMRRKYYRMMAHGKTRNVAVTAIARELACFIWGMMTEDILMSA